MKAIMPNGFGPAMHLELGDRGTPKPGRGDVLVRVVAASVNPKDWKLNWSLAMLATPLGARFMPPVFGDDLAGEIVAVGANVEGFQPGDEVYGMDMRLRTASLAEYAVISQKRIAPVPANASFNEAAAAPLAAQTALQGLRKGFAARGRSVLIIGASGGVGSYAVQIAKIMGCRVTGVCSTRNIELVRGLGADEVVDYTAGDYRQSAGKFDLVFDVTSFETPSSCAVLRTPGGYFLSTIGHSRALAGTLLARDPRASVIMVESYTRDLKTIAEWMAAGQLRSIIDSSWSLADAQKAYERSRSGRSRGKIVIEVASSTDQSVQA